MLVIGIFVSSGAISPVMVPEVFDLDEFGYDSLDVDVIHHHGKVPCIVFKFFDVSVLDHFPSSNSMILLFWTSLRYWIRVSFRSLFRSPVSLK